jgi:hypothetical protein
MNSIRDAAVVVIVYRNVFGLINHFSNGRACVTLQTVWARRCDIAR